MCDGRSLSALGDARTRGAIVALLNVFEMWLRSQKLYVEELEPFGLVSVVPGRVFGRCFLSIVSSITKIAALNLDI